MTKRNNLETLVNRARALRIPSEIAVPIIKEFQKLRDHNGDEWVCNRYKSIKLDFIRMKSGLRPISPWVARNDDKFRGPLGGLQTYANKKRKNWSNAIQLLQVYSSLIASSPTKQQIEKFVGAVEQANDSSFISCYTTIASNAVKALGLKRCYLPNPESILLRPISEGRSEPHASGKSYVEGTNTLGCIQSFMIGTVEGRSFRSRYKNIFDGALQGITFETKPIYGSFSGGVAYSNGNVGKIGLIQEPGYKLRAVANPGRIYQQALQPLGDYLYSLLRDLPWDCTHSQDKGYFVIQNHLSSGLQCHAVDLSNATDRFPLEIQMGVLRNVVYNHEHINLFEELSKSKWYCSISPSKRLQWKVGQPLGLYPSFAAFALTHGLILYALNNYKHDNLFFVLGDDVVILDDHLYDKYILFLMRCGIPYSPSKTLSSNLITEFGGKLITKDDVIPQLKWRIISDDSFMDIMRNIGQSAVSLLRTRQRLIYDKVCAIPEFLGGCGHNPHGIPLPERVKLYYDLVNQWKSTSFLLSYNGQINTYNYKLFDEPGLTMVPSCDSSALGAFDQKAAQFAISLNSRLSWIIGINRDPLWTKVFGSPLYNVFPENRDVPIENRECSRITTLVSLERKFSS